MTAKRMTAAQAVILCRFAKACCPQQAFDEYTPDAWFELLGDLRFEDCKEALVAVVKSQPFCSPAEIRAKLGSVRRERIIAFGPIDPGSRFDGDFTAEIAWINSIKQRVGDGALTREEFDAEQAAVEAGGKREMPALEGVFRHVD